MFCSCQKGGSLAEKPEKSTVYGAPWIYFIMFWSKMQPLKLFFWKRALCGSLFTPAPITALTGVAYAAKPKGLPLAEGGFKWAFPVTIRTFTE